MATKIERERNKERAIHDKVDLILKLLKEVLQEVQGVERKDIKKSSKVSSKKN